MANILIMIPAGEVYDHDCVRWYDHKNISRSIDHYHNIGDAFVYDSTLKLLDYDRVEVLPLANFDPHTIDRLRAEFDYVVLRGSNYIHSAMRWWHAEEVLNRLRLPVIAFGVGAQAAHDGTLTLSPESERIWHMIADSTETIGVRGAHTADILWSIGITNTRIVGCPTAFRCNDPCLEITLPDLAEVRHVGLTLRREVSPEYARNIETYVTRHRDLIDAMAERFDLTLMAQGEVEEKKMVFGDAAQKAAAMADLEAQDWWRNWYLSDTVRRLYDTRLFYSDVVADYEDLVRRLDLVLGYRLHGNLMALSNGIPSVYFTYDSRTTEFAETFAIPCVDVFDEKPFRLEDYWEQALFDRFNRAYRHRYRDMKAFLDENHVANSMRGSAGAAAPARLALAGQSFRNQASRGNM